MVGVAIGPPRGQPEIAGTGTVGEGIGQPILVVGDLAVR
jgi:hypothetical protein